MAPCAAAAADTPAGLVVSVAPSAASQLGHEGFRIVLVSHPRRLVQISAATESAALYGAYRLLARLQRREPLINVTSIPNTRLRHWDLWDELSGAV